MLFKISDFSLSARNQPIYYAPKQVFESVYTIWDVYLCILAETVKLRRSQIRISNSIISLIEVNVLLIMKFSGQGYKNSIAEESRRLQKLFLKLNFLRVCLLHLIWYYNILWKVRSWKHSNHKMITFYSCVFKRLFSHVWDSHVW